MDAPDLDGTGSLLRRSLAETAREWRPLLAADLAWKLLAFAALTPLLVLVLRAGIALSGDGALADQEIVFFLLRPFGLAFLLLVAAAALAIVALEQASLMAIAAARAAGTRLTASGAIAWAAGHALPVLRVSFRLVDRCLALALPFLVGAGLVWALLLGKYDINYYLQARPPAFWTAAALVALLAAGLVRVLLPRIVDWCLALPLVLFAGVPAPQALGESRRRVAAERRTARRAILLWATLALLLSTALPGLVALLARGLAPSGRGNLALLLPLMLLLLVLWAGAGLLASAAGAALAAVLLVRLFERCGGHPEVVGGEAAAEEFAPPLRRSRRRTLVAALLAAAVVAAVGIWLALGVRGHDDVRIVAHRGAAAVAPENTLAAVEAAIVQRADSVEIDVQETADGELAVVHDSDFMKLAGVDLEVWNTDWEQVRQIDVGAHRGPVFAGERVPSLREVLERARGRAAVTIELKVYGHGQQLEQRVIDLVEELGLADRVTLMSLDYGTVRVLRALRPTWTVGLLTATAVGDLTSVDAHFLAVNASLATRGFVRRAHRRGKQVWVWTVDDPVRMFQMMNLGVDAIITNDPGLARSVLERRARLSTAERLLVGLSFFFGAGAPDPPVSAEDA